MSDQTSIFMRGLLECWGGGADVLKPDFESQEAPEDNGMVGSASVFPQKPVDLVAGHIRLNGGARREAGFQVTGVGAAPQPFRIVGVTGDSMGFPEGFPEAPHHASCQYTPFGSAGWKAGFFPRDVADVPREFTQKCFIAKPRSTQPLLR